MNLLYVIGIFVSLGVLVFLCMKGVHPILSGISAAIVVALFGRLNLVTAMSEDYMQGFVDFMKSNYLIFFAGTAYGVIMKASGAAEAVANWLMKLIGSKYSLYAVAITIIALMYGGINGFVIIFTIWPIMVQVFRETDTSRTLMPCLYFIGAGSIANAGPGTPQLLNLVVAESYGVSSMAAPVIGFIGAGTMLVLQFVWFGRLVKKSKERGERFDPAGLVEDVSEELKARETRKLPNVFLAVLPLVACLVLLNIKSGGENIFPVVVALWLAVVVAVVCNIRYLDMKKLPEYITEGCTSAVNIIVATCGVMGFAAVVRATPGFQALIDVIPNIQLPPLLSLFLMTNVFCAITGTATGAASVVSSILGPIYTSMGLAPELAARIQILSATGFDTVPHNGTLVASINMAHETHKTTYKYCFQCSVLIPMIGALVGIAFSYILGMV